MSRVMALQKPPGPRPVLSESPASPPRHDAEIAQLRADLAQATAARDALAHQFAALLSQNAALLRATRSLEGSPRAPSPRTYAGTLLQRRQAIAAAELLEEIGPSPGGAAGGGGGGRVGSPVSGEAVQLREAVSLLLERLRTLRWREIILESSLAELAGFKPGSKTLAAELQRMPRGHPLRARLGELATLYEEVAATRSELCIASSRLGKLSPKPARAASPARPRTSPGAPGASPAARRPRTAAPSPAARSSGPRAGGPPVQQPRSTVAADPVSEQAASRWADFVKHFERQQEATQRAAQRAAAQAAAESEEEEDR